MQIKNWPKTEFTERAGIEIPLIQAPMTGITTPELVIAVSKVGGVGSLGAAYMQPDELRSAIHRIREKTRRPFNVNLFIPTPLHAQLNIDPFVNHLKKYESLLGFALSTDMPHHPSFEKQVEVLLQEGVPIFSFTFGIPPLAVIRDFQKRNALVIGTATHLTEALALQEAGVDFIVVQGNEAGGHRGTFIEDSHQPTMELLKAMKKEIKKPLIAAGGIMHGKEITAALKAGASAVQLGTLFIPCTESQAHPSHKKALLEWRNRPTLLTRAFTGKWARAIENRFIQDTPDHLIPPFPIAQALTSSLREAAASANNPEFLSLWAGEHFQNCRAGSAQEIIAQLSLEM